MTLEYVVHVIFIPLDVHKLSPLENTEIGIALIHHVHAKLSWSSLVIIYMCKKWSNTPGIRSLIHAFTLTLSPYDIYYQQISEILSNQLPFF